MQEIRGTGPQCYCLPSPLGELGSGVFRDASGCGLCTGTGSDADSFIHSQGLLAARGSNSEEMRLTKNACGRAELKLGQIAEGPVVVTGMKCLPALASGVECRLPRVMDGRQLGRSTQPGWACLASVCLPRGPGHIANVSSQVGANR